MTTYIEFTGALDGEAAAPGFVPFSGELDGPETPPLADLTDAAMPMTSLVSQVPAAEPRRTKVPEGAWEDPREGSWDDRTQAGKGIDSAITGMKSMQPAAAITANALAVDRIGKRLADWDRIDAGEKVPRAVGLAYERADTAGRQAMRDELLAGAAKSKDFIQASIPLVKRFQAEQMANRGRTVDATDIEDVKSFGDWLAFNGAAGAVYLAPVMLSAALGGAPGAAAASYALAAGELNSDRVAAAIDMNRPERFKNPDRQAQVDQAQGVAQRAAATAGETAAYAVPMAALDVVAGPVRGAITKPLQGLTRREVLRRAPGEMVKDVLEEGATGAAQEVVGIAAERAAGEQTGDVFTADNVKRVINAGAAEAAGGPTGTAFNVANSLRTASATGVPPAADPTSDPIETTKPILAAPTVDAAIAEAQRSVSAAAASTGSTAVDNISRLLAERGLNVGAPAAVPGVPAGASGGGSLDATPGMDLGAGQPAGGPALDPAGGVAGATALAVPLGPDGGGAAVAPTVIRNETGTVTIQGDPKALRALLKSNGITQVLARADGVLVGTSQAEQAAQLMADFDGSNAPVAPAPAAPAVLPQPMAPAVAATTATPAAPAIGAVEPVETWVGRRGDGYAAQGDASVAMKTRQRIHPELEWRIETLPSGRFRLAGYAEGAQNAPAAQPEATADAALLPFDGVLDAVPAPAPVLPAAPVSGGRSARGRAFDANPFRAFLGKHGLAADLVAEFAPGARERRGAMVQGYGPIFRKTGKSLDDLAQSAVEEGFLTEPNADQLYQLVARAMGGERIIPQYAEGAVEREMESRIAREREFEADAVAALADLQDNELFEIDDVPGMDAESNVSADAAMRALGFTDQEISDATAERTEGSPEGGESSGRPVEAASGEAQGTDRGRESEARADREGLSDEAPDEGEDPGRTGAAVDGSQDGEPGRSQTRRVPPDARDASDGAGVRNAEDRAPEGLTAPSKQDILKQKEQRRRVERVAAERKKLEDHRVRADAERAEFTLTGSDRKSDANPDQQDLLGGLSTADTDKVVEAFRAVGMDLQVADTEADLPGVGQDRMQSEGISGVRGMYDPSTGKVWLVRSNVSSVREAAFVALHEALHRGLTRTYGEKVRSLLNYLELNNKGLRDKARAYREQFDGMGRLESIEEVLADMAGKGNAADLKGWDRVVAFIRDAIGKVAQKLGISMEVSDAQVQRLVAQLRRAGTPEDEVHFETGDMQPAYSRGTGALERIAETFPDAFAVPRSDAKTMEAIAAEIAPGITVRKVGGGGPEQFRLIHDQSGREASITVTRGTGERFYEIDAEAGIADNERPGVNPQDVPDGTPDVYLNIADNAPGGDFGMLAYNLAANYAHAIDGIFIGDPNGLSDPALRRRTEQMLNSALKFGTTAHLAPHPRQVRGDAKKGVPPLRWVYGDHEGNVERMMGVSRKALAAAFPSSSKIEHRDGEFYRTDTGQRFTSRSELARILSKAIGARRDDGRGLAAQPGNEPGARGTAGSGIAQGQAGWRTVARNALFAEAAAAQARDGADGRSVLDRLFDLLPGIERDGATGEAFQPSRRILYSRKSVAETTADDATPAVDPKLSPWRDETGRLQFAPGAWLYAALGKAAGPLLGKLELKAQTKELRRAMRAMKLTVQQAQETATAVAGEAMKLSDDERAMVSDLIEQEAKIGAVPPEHAVRLAAIINSTMGAQTDELIRLGMLDKEVADRLRGKYLPRYYKDKLGKHVESAWQAAVRGVTRKPKGLTGMRAKHLKGRGMYETIPVTELPAWEQMGWEVRDADYQAGLVEGGQVQVWRDFSREERDAMGEIRDAGFRFVMGYMETQRDIALGRMFEQMAQDPGLSSKKETEQFSVMVPDNTVAGTGVKQYGKMAGRWVSPETMSHLSAVGESQNEALQMYRKALGIWKEGKTALNPVAHVNNILSNLSMAHFAGVSYWETHKYVAAARDFATKNESIKEAKDAGLFLGTVSQEELYNTLPEDLKALVRTQDSTAVKTGRTAFNLMTFFLRRPMGAAYQAEDTFFRYLIWKDARARGMSAEDAVDYSLRYIFNYDDLPKGARRLRDFAIPFVSYTYKAAPALLHTALTHPLRFAAPAAVLWAANAAAYAIANGEDEDDWDEKLKRYLTDPGYREAALEKEKIEREHLPSWMKGNTSLGTPKAIRLGTDELTKLPMFLDTSRIIPGGDMFDMHPNGGGIPWMQPLTPNHPLLSTFMAMFHNKDAWQGKEITDANDTRMEATEKRLAWMWRQFTPAIAAGQYHWERGMQALAQASGGEVKWLPEWLSEDYTGVGKDGLPVQPKHAVMQTFGIKVRPLDLDKSADIAESQDKKLVRDIDTEIRRLDRVNKMGAISDGVYDKEWKKAQEKKGRVKDGKTVDGDDKE